MSIRLFVVAALQVTVVGASTVVTVAGSGTQGITDGTGTGASFNYPAGIAYSPDGTKALIADSYNHLIREMTLGTWEVVTVAGTGSFGAADGTGTGASFNEPYGIAYSPDGTKALITDGGGQVIREMTLDTWEVVTVAGTGSQGWADGTGTGASFNYPTGIAYSPDGTKALIADSCYTCMGPGTSGHVIREMTLDTWEVVTVAGTAGSRGITDGTGTGASFNEPTGIAYSPDGTKALITDNAGHLIREMTLDTWEVVTVAGTGSQGAADGTGTGASFNYPAGIAYSPDGTKALIVDNVGHLIREMTVAVTVPVSTCADTNGDGTVDDPFDCSGDPANDIHATPATVTCATDASCTETECCTVPVSTCADANGDGTVDDPFDCSGDPANDIHATPATVTCATDGSCTETECCTVPHTVPPSKVSGAIVPATSASAAAPLAAFAALVAALA